MRTYHKLLSVFLIGMLASGCTEVLSFTAGFAAGFGTHYYISQSEQKDRQSVAASAAAQRMAYGDSYGSNSMRAPVIGAPGAYPPPSPYDTYAGGYAAPSSGIPTPRSKPPQFGQSATANPGYGSYQPMGGHAQNSVNPHYAGYNMSMQAYPGGYGGGQYYPR